MGPDIPIVRRHGSSFRRLTLIGSDGSQRHFIVQTSLTPNARSDERILQLFRVMNRMFDKHKESRRRHISIHTPIIIPVWSQVIKLLQRDQILSALIIYSKFLAINGSFNVTLWHYVVFYYFIINLIRAFLPSVKLIPISKSTNTI